MQRIRREKSLEKALLDTISIDIFEETDDDPFWREFNRKGDVIFGGFMDPPKDPPDRYFPTGSLPNVAAKDLGSSGFPNSNGSSGLPNANDPPKDPPGRYFPTGSLPNVVAKDSGSSGFHNTNGSAGLPNSDVLSKDVSDDANVLHAGSSGLPRDAANYPRFLYFHELSKKSEQLGRSTKKNDGCREPLSEIGIIKRAHTVLITQRMFYAFRNLHEIPHGTEETNKLAEHDELLRKHNVETITHSPSKLKNFTVFSDKVRVAQPTSSILLEFDGMINHKGWLEFIVDAGKPDKKRNAEVAAGAVVSRVVFSWTRKQNRNYPHTEFYEGLQKPHPSYKAKLKINQHPELKQELAKILDHAQESLETMFKEREIMNDDLRTELFGLPMCKHFHASCMAKFEHIELYVECLSTLNRHMDYFNDHREGYNIGCSHSCTIVHNANLYRVNFIMCTREHCGKFMDDLDRRL